MNRSQFAQLCGILAAVLLVAGAILYAINAPNSSLTRFTLAAGLVLMALFVILNIGDIRAFFGKRSSKHGANMLVMIILFTCIIAVIQTLSVRHNKRIDLTRNARFSLASQTISLIENLGADISITAFYQKSAAEKMRAEDLLAQYAHRTKHIHYEFVDPDRKPQLAKEMGITNYGTTIIQRGDKKELLTELSEETLTNAILKISRDMVKTVNFLQGHGEKDPQGRENIGYSILKEAIEKEGYNVGTLSLFDEAAVPDDVYILIVAGPVQDLFESEITKLKEYLATGRSAVFMLDPFISLPHVETLLAEYGLAVDDNIVIDPYSRLFGGEYTIPVVTQYVDHPVTKGFKVATFYPVARSVRMLGEPGDCEVQYLAQTGKSAWGENDLEAYREGAAARDDTDIPAPVPLAAISSRNSPAAAGDPGGSKIIVFVDSDFAANASFRVSGNADFLMNTINFLAEEKDLIAIRPKRGMGDYISLTASQGRLIFLLSVVILPLSVITLGSTLFLRRRRRG